MGLWQLYPSKWDKCSSKYYEARIKSRFFHPCRRCLVKCNHMYCETATSTCEFSLSKMMMYPFICIFWQSRPGHFKIIHTKYLQRWHTHTLDWFVQPPHLFECCKTKTMAKAIAWLSILGHLGFHLKILWKKGWVTLRLWLTKQFSYSHNRSRSSNIWNGDQGLLHNTALGLE